MGIDNRSDIGNSSISESYVHLSDGVNVCDDDKRSIQSCGCFYIVYESERMWCNDKRFVHYQCDKHFKK